MISNLSMQGPSNGITDASELTSLKLKAVKDPKSAAQDAAKKFEALILQEVMKAGRAPSMDSGLFSSEASKTYTQLMDKQLSEVAAKKGTGLGRFIENAMLKGQK